MIRKSFCDFFRNFKYFFTACGVIYLVFIIIIASLVGFSFQLVKALSADAVEEIRVLADNMVAALGTAPSFTLEFYADFIDDVIAVIVKNIDNFAAKFLSVSGAYIIVLSLAFTYATRLCKKSIRAEAIKLVFFKSLAANAARIITAAVFMALYFLIANSWKYGVIPLCIIAALLIIAENLFSTWLIYFRNKPLREFINLKNTLSLIGAYLVMLLLMCAVISLCTIFLGQFVSLIIALPLLAYTLAVMDGISVSYFEDRFGK